MKTILLVVAYMLFSCMHINAQKIDYETSLEKAKAIALEQNKPIAILFAIPFGGAPSAFIDDALSIDTVATAFNSHFINYKVDKRDTLSTRLLQQYKINSFPCFLFLDSKGSVLSKSVRIAFNKNRLLEIVNDVVALSKDKTLTDYDSAYARGNTATAFLRNYIIKRKRAGISNNAELIEKYVDSLTVVDFNDYQQVLFILQAGPVIDGKAYKLAHTNQRLYDSIFKTEPFTIRNALNTVIADNSMAYAIANKKPTIASAAASLSRSMFTTDYRISQKNYTLKMLAYYKAVKDTTNYLSQAASYYDYNFMNITVDSIRKMDKAAYEKQKQLAEKRIMSNVTTPDISPSFLQDSTQTKYYATTLNNAAFSFYEMGASSSNAYAFKALAWSKRSIELNPTANYYDTYAHLLYRLEMYAEAESTQQKAVELSKNNTKQNQTFKDVLQKIRSRTL